MHWLVFFLCLVIVQIFTILILEFRKPSKTVAWLFILFVFPIIGFVMYYFLASEYRSRKKVEKRTLHAPFDMKRQYRSYLKSEPVPAVITARLGKLLASIPYSPLSSNNRVEVLFNAVDTYEAMMKAMKEAQEHIHLEYYTFRPDEAGQPFLKLLRKKAMEGVRVRLIFDGVGTMDLKKPELTLLKEAGVEFTCFLPPLFAFFDKRMNYRNHRKLVVIDGKVGFLGGINIGEEYLGGNPKLGYWRDTHLKLTGKAVHALQYVFMKDWQLSKEEELIEGGLFQGDLEEHGMEPVQIIASGPDAAWDSILEAYFSAISAAEESVYITTPYFIPDSSVIMALKTAALSGVDVRVIFPQRSDSVLVRWASLSYLEELLEAGVKFYEYTRGFIHAKILIVDRKIASVGTANMDMRSFFDNFELNAMLYDPKNIAVLLRDFQQDLKDSEEVELKDFEQRSRWMKMKEAVGRMLSPLL
ncbi:cardiolipin synthase [Marinicrinis sediminis]|uniref:Cardiolipin synthase n=1 Tax=Marinicrinis sediminis TaxID=1652465 RepID=A0ABW5R746_9BACL